jgi:coenzyme F420-reducing hydrogenase alpha subunit
MGVAVTSETEKLRTVLEHAQFIHSHALHLFFLSLADFLDIDNDIKLVEKYPEQAKRAIHIREYGMEVVKIIGGRVVHPLTNEVGGFKKAPDAEGLRRIVADSKAVLGEAKELGEFFKTIKIPDFSRETEYVALGKKGEYAIYDGDIISSRGLNIPVSKFEESFRELEHQPASTRGGSLTRFDSKRRSVESRRARGGQEVVKKVKYDGKSYMIGAIARVNINKGRLSENAYAYLASLNLKFPNYNPFNNILCQMTEVIHSIEQTEKLIKELLQADLEKVVTTEYEIRAGVGVAAVEAPRGTLYYSVEVDGKGYVKNVNIITPTAQFLSNLEDDIMEYIPHIINLGDTARQRKLRAFIRAYDPCISCAVH